MPPSTPSTPSNLDPILDRIADQLERIGDLLEAHLVVVSPEYRKTGRITNRTPKMVEVSVPSVEEWNKKWDERRGVGEGGES